MTSQESDFIMVKSGEYVSDPEASAVTGERDYIDHPIPISWIRIKL